MNKKRKYDLVLFGATGFTGRLVVRYLKAAAARESFSWAIAGRNEAKLYSVASDEGITDVPRLVADIADQASMDELANSCRVLITTVGPYIHYGEPALSACARAGTHYLDLTGEPEFVDKMIVAWDDTARASGAKIVNCCGFDSIPHDHGVLYTVQQLVEAGADPQAEFAVQGYVRASGSFSGGTWHSALNAFARAPRYEAWRRQNRDDLRPADPVRRVKGDAPRIGRNSELSCWTVPMPTVDPQIVLRSAQALPGYGTSFRYGHYACIKNLSTIVAGGIGLPLLFAGAQVPPVKSLLLKVRNPGNGPDQATRAKSRFSVDFFGTAGSRTVHTRVSGGDPGYDETAKMLAEAALCIALDKDTPDFAGVITPAMATGNALIRRLQAADIKFEVL